MCNRAAELNKINTENWFVETMDGTRCDRYFLEEKIAVDKKINVQAAIDKQINAQKKFITDKLVNKKIINSPLDSIYAIKNEKCRNFILDLFLFIDTSHETKIKGGENIIKERIDHDMSQIDLDICK